MDGAQTRVREVNAGLTDTLRQGQAEDSLWSLWLRRHN